MARPPEFERSTVVRQAKEVFCRRGYGATSVAHLVNATGLKPGSLYAAFGSKKGLFLEVLDEYNNAYLGAISRQLGTAESPLVSIRSLFDLVIDDTISVHGKSGCLAVNTLLEMAEHDDEIASRLRQHNRKMRLLLLQALSIAKETGEIGNSKNPELLSVFVMNNLLGLRVLCKHPPKKSELQGIVDGVMSALKN